MLNLAEIVRLGQFFRYASSRIALGIIWALVSETIYCARGQAENLIKLHKAQLASDRASCRSPLANQMRLILQTAAYWLILTVRDAISKAHALATAEFAILRLRLLKLGTRVIATASRVRLAFAAACPDVRLIRHIAAGLMPAAL